MSKKLIGLFLFVNIVLPLDGFAATDKYMDCYSKLTAVTPSESYKVGNSGFLEAPVGIIHDEFYRLNNNSIELCKLEKKWGKANRLYIKMPDTDGVNSKTIYFSYSPLGSSEENEGSFGPKGFIDLSDIEKIHLKDKDFGNLTCASVSENDAITVWQVLIKSKIYTLETHFKLKSLFSMLPLLSKPKKEEYLNLIKACELIEDKSISSYAEQAKSTINRIQPQADRAKSTPAVK